MSRASHFHKFTSRATWQIHMQRNSILYAWPDSYIPLIFKQTCQILKKKRKEL